MADTLDTLIAKAKALEAMRLRGDAGYPEALALFTLERDAWVKRMSAEVMPDKNDAGPVSMSDLTVMDADLAKLIIVLRKINWLDHANGGIVITQRDFDRLQKLLTQLEDKYI